VPFYPKKKLLTIQVDTLSGFFLDAGAVPAASTYSAKTKGTRKTEASGLTSGQKKGLRGKRFFPLYVVGVSSGKGNLPCPGSDSDGRGGSTRRLHIFSKN